MNFTSNHIWSVFSGRTLLSLYVGEEGQGTGRERFSTRGTPGILSTIGEVATSPEGERVGGACAQATPVWHEREEDRANPSRRKPEATPDAVHGGDERDAPEVEVGAVGGAAQGAREGRQGATGGDDGQAATGDVGRAQKR